MSGLELVGAKFVEWASGEAFNFCMNAATRKYGNDDFARRLRRHIAQFSKIQMSAENIYIVEKVQKLNEILSSMKDLITFNDQTEPQFVELEKTLNAYLLEIVIDKAFDLTDEEGSANGPVTLTLAVELKEVKEESVLKKDSSSITYKGKFGIRDVAIKTKVPQTVGRHEDENFYREAVILQVLNERHLGGVIRYYGVDNLTTPTKIVLEFGKSNLEEFLRDNTLYPLSSRLRVLRECCKIFANLIGQGILHRDIKPENILVTSDNDIKVMNFGFVKSKEAGLSSGVTLRGTHSYVAPELLMNTSGHYQYSEATEMYSFAVMMNRVLTDVIPFEKYSQTQLIGLMFKTSGLQRPDLLTPSAYPGNEGVCQAVGGLITLCWSSMPLLRLTFKQVIEQLSALIDNCKDVEELVATAVNESGTPVSVFTTASSSSASS